MTYSGTQQPLSRLEVELLTLEVEGERQRGRWHLKPRWRTAFVARLLATILALRAALERCKRCPSCESIAWAALNNLEEREEHEDLSK